MILKKGIKHGIVSQWNTLAPGKRVKMLLNKIPSIPTKNIKKMDVIDHDSVHEALREEATTSNTAAEEDAAPIWANRTTKVDSKSKADCHNLGRQAAIGAK